MLAASEARGDLEQVHYPSFQVAPRAYHVLTAASHNTVYTIAFGN